MSCTVTGFYPKRLSPLFLALLSRPSLPRDCTMAPPITPRGFRLFLDLRLNVCLASPSSSRLVRLIAPVSLLHWPPWISPGSCRSAQGCSLSPPGHIGRPSHAHPGSIPSDRFFESPPVGARRTVYVHFHCSAGFSPLHSVLGTGTFRMSLCVLSTDDHVTWTPTLFHGESTSNETRPTSRVLLLTGLLRGLWDFDPEDDLCNINISSRITLPLSPSALHPPRSPMK